MATHTAAPMTGKWSSTAGKRRLANTLAPMAASRIAPTIACMKQRDAEQRQAEQDEIDRNTGDAHAFSATSTSSSIFFASPNSIRLLSL